MSRGVHIYLLHFSTLNFYLENGYTWAAEMPVSKAPFNKIIMIIIRIIVNIIS